jgi:hypothetical protein
MTAMTSNSLPTLATPNLDADARLELLEALQAHLDGSDVEISVTYHKVTNSKARIEGEDYKGLLGVSKNVLIGKVKKIAVGKNGPYILLDATLTREPLNGKGEKTTENIGWTAIKGEGIDTVEGTRTEAKKEA